jgi:hypothetical protein
MRSGSTLERHVTRATSPPTRARPSATALFACERVSPKHVSALSSLISSLSTFHYTRPPRPVNTASLVDETPNRPSFSTLLNDMFNKNNIANSANMPKKTQNRQIPLKKFKSWGIMCTRYF